MSKKRKTRKEKMIAATRHDFSTVLTSSPSESKQEIRIEMPQSKYVESVTPRSTVSHNYSYVAVDVRQTLLITSLLVLLDIVFFFILKSRLISFSGILF